MTVAVPVTPVDMCHFVDMYTAGGSHVLIVTDTVNLQHMVC